MPIYFDHNATAVPDPVAARAAADWLLSGGGNPSSVHHAGRRARAVVERARAQVAAALGGRPGETIFTSGATESLHTAVSGLAGPGAHAVVSAVEHPAVFGACRAAGIEVSIVPVDDRGRLKPAAFAAALRPTTAFVAVMAAQNELGNLYAVPEIAAAVGPVPVLCDAVQHFGRLPLDVGTLGAALVAVSGHKIGAPGGVGALWVKAGLCLRPLLEGGPQERGRRAGTENVSGIVGFGVAASRIDERVAAAPRVAAVRERLLVGLRALTPQPLFHGDPESALPNTLSFRFPDVPGDALLAALDLAGFCLSSGAACSAGALTPSPVLRALGLAPAEAAGALRLSLGPESTAQEADAFLDALPALLERIRSAQRRHGRL